MRSGHPKLPDSWTGSDPETLAVLIPSPADFFRKNHEPAEFFVAAPTRSPEPVPIGYAQRSAGGGHHTMRILFFGDIVGRPARVTLLRELPKLAAEYGADYIVGNAENASGAWGSTWPTPPSSLRQASMP